MIWANSVGTKEYALMKAKKKKATKLRVVVFKTKHAEYKQMTKLARKLTNGNLSLLIRARVLGQRLPC